MPPAERIATFDNDGTLWCEQPMYFQLMFAIDRVKAIAPQHPEWKDKEPFASLLKGDVQAHSPAANTAMLEIVMSTHAGMTTAEFEQIVKDWLATAKHPRFKRPYTECVYQPMLELLAYLRANGFKTFIVSGGGIEFMRPWTERVYGIPPEQVVGSSIKTKFEMRDGEPVLVRLPEIELHQRQGWEADWHQLAHWPPADRRLWQLGRRSADARVDASRRRTAHDAGSPRRRDSRVRLRRRFEDRHVFRLADGRSEEAGLDRHQHEKRLEANFSFRKVKQC